MKKIVYALALSSLLLAACHKASPEAAQMVTLSFEHCIVESNSMVRSTSNDYLDIIADHTPSVVTVTLNNLDLGTAYTCQSNEQIIIPVGNYTISATSTISGEINGSKAANRPHIRQSATSMQITSETTSITLHLSYNCYAVFALIDECASCEVFASSYTDNRKELQKVGKYYVAYGKGDNTFYLEPYAEDTEHISTEIKMVTTYDTTNTYAEFGKYYVLHPTKMDTSSSTFDTNIPPMEEGEI